jgi:hypothetical protein
MPSPQCSRAPSLEFRLSGPLAKYLANVIEHWLKPAPEANPAICCSRL